MRRLILPFLGLALGLMLAACNGNPPQERLPPVSFKDQKPFMLNIARIEIVSKYQSSSTPPHIELEAPVSPENAIKKLIEDRIKPDGTNGTLRVVINDASLIQTPLPKDTSLTGDFTNQQTARVDVSIDVALQMLDEHQFVKAEVTGRASRSRTLPEDLKLNQRDKILYDMVVATTRSLGEEITPRIESTFAAWAMQ